MAASSFFRSSSSSRDTSLGRELLLVHAGTVVEGSGFSPFVMDTDLRILPDRSRAVPFDMLVSGIAGIVVESVVASDMTTSFADPVEEAEPVEDTDSIDADCLEYIPEKNYRTNILGATMIDSQNLH